MSCSTRFGRLMLLGLTSVVLGGPAVAAETTWTDTMSNWADAAAWSGGLPTAADTAIFAGGGSDPFLSGYAQVLGAPAQAGLLRFATGALYYTLSIDDELTLGGIENLSTVQQEINVQGLLRVNGGTIDGDVLIRGLGGIGADNLVFENTASAGTATIALSGGMTVRFKDQARGGTADISVSSGSVVFEDETNAEAAHIRLQGNGTTASFEGQSTAGTAEITTTSGNIIFNDTATAGGATLRNDASQFGNRGIIFNDSSSAGNAAIYSGVAGNGASRVNFFETSSAGTARLVAQSGGKITFYDQSDAADAAFVLDGGTIELNMSWSNGDFTAGSLEGTGTVGIRDKLFVVGSNNASTSFAGRITGTGNVAKVGTGTLTLTGSSHTYTGLTTVSQGLLAVNGSLTQSAGIAVMADGSLGGSGQLPSVAINGGKLAPGNSIGTLQVNGDLDLTAVSIYEVEVNAAGEADRTQVTGTANLGGTVQVLPEAGTYSPSTTYTILTAGTVVGSFGGVTSNLAFLTPTLSYQGQNVILTLTRNSTSLASVGETLNQRATATGITSLGAGNPVYDAITGLSAEGARASFDGLSGEIHATLPGLLITDDTVRRAMQTRASLRQDGVDGFVLMEGGLAGWASDGNAAAVQRGDGEVVAGLDAGSSDARLGLLLHGGTGQTEIGQRQSSARDASYGAGIYGSWDGEGPGLSFGLDATRYDIAARRQVAIGGGQQLLEADYAATRLQGFGELRYQMQIGTTRVTPFASLAQVRLARDGFAETGGTAALSGEAGLLDATFTTLGLRLATETGKATRLAGMVGWRHTEMSTPMATQRFAGGTAFSVFGPEVGKDALVLEGRLDLPIGSGARLGLSYDGQLGIGAQSHAIKAGFSGRF